jgi:3-oxoadipate enol-lactonase
MLFHTVNGQGDAVVLLNGVAMSIASWEPVASRLAQSYSVVRCDLRGQLMSPGNPPQDIAAHADDVIELLDHLDIARCHLVGTSFGGAVAAIIAARRPDRARSLISIASGSGFTGAMATEVRRWQHAALDVLAGNRTALSDALEPVVYSPAYLDRGRDEREARRAQVAALPDQWFEDLATLLSSADSFDLRGELGRIRCPTLIIAAELDGFVPPEQTQALAQAIQGARLEVMPGAGHAVVIEQPQELAQRCLRFLGAL